MSTRLPWLATFALALACAANPRPRIMTEVDAVREGPAAREARELAGPSYAHAEQLRRQAEQAHEANDHPTAQILSEHALAAYSHAFVLARVAKAQRRVAEAGARLSRAQADLARLDQQQQRLAAEADDLELQAKVIRDAMPIASSGPATPERDQARLQAGRSLAVQAQLLCLATRLLAPDTEGLAAELERVAALGQKLAGKFSPAPIDEAIAARSACLQRLTLARRPKSREAPASGASDALLAELGQAGDLAPFRDDRGVVVALREVVGADGKLSQTGSERLALLGRVAKAHPEFPVLVVVHSARGLPTPHDVETAKAIAQALSGAGAPKVDTAQAGDALPLVDRKNAGATDRNTRVEIVFVAPAS